MRVSAGSGRPFGIPVAVGRSRNIRRPPLRQRLKRIAETCLQSVVRAQSEARPEGRHPYRDYPSRFRGRGFFQPRNGLGVRRLLVQRIPIIGRIAVVQHSLEDLVGVRLGDVGPQAVLVNHPGEDDHLAGAAVAEEKPETAVAEFGAEPVLAINTKGESWR